MPQANTRTYRGDSKVLIGVGILRSYEHMGIAELKCVSGEVVDAAHCRCVHTRAYMPCVIDLHISTEKTPQSNCAELLGDVGNVSGYVDRMSAGCECESKLMDGQWESRTSQSEWQYVAGMRPSIGRRTATAEWTPHREPAANSRCHAVRDVYAAIFAVRSQPA